MTEPWHLTFVFSRLTIRPEDLSSLDGQVWCYDSYIMIATTVTEMPAIPCMQQKSVRNSDSLLGLDEQTSPLCPTRGRSGNNFKSNRLWSSGLPECFFTSEKFHQIITHLYFLQGKISVSVPGLYVVHILLGAYRFLFRTLYSWQAHWVTITTHRQIKLQLAPRSLKQIIDTGSKWSKNPIDLISAVLCVVFSWPLDWAGQWEGDPGGHIMWSIYVVPCQPPHPCAPGSNLEWNGEQREP